MGEVSDTKGIIQTKLEHFSEWLESYASGDTDII